MSLSWPRTYGSRKSAHSFKIAGLVDAARRSCRKPPPYSMPMTAACTSERFQSRRDEFPRRREKDRGVRFLGQPAKIRARPGGPERSRLADMILSSSRTRGQSLGLTGQLALG
jgi:hypothetical protein